MPVQPRYGFDHLAAVRHLRACDPLLADLIRRVGRFRLGIGAQTSPFAALLEAIVYQQLHGSAAAAILRRVKEAIGAGQFPTPLQVASAPLATLRATGLSRQKIAALRDLAEKTRAGVVPGMRTIQSLGDDQIVARLTAVRGVGAWSVHMLLIFRLGRPDVLPTLDYGVRQGYALTYKKPTLPKPLELAKVGEAWRPFRSVASWYFWRAVDLERAANSSAAGSRAARPAPPKP